MNGCIHSIQSLGTLDGPGVRVVVFVQGCQLRCKYCHNPDTWDFDKGKVIKDKEIFEKIMRYKNYFGEEGGLTVSGGEPLMQAEFVCELFKMCKESGITTALDTSGCIYNKKIDELLNYTDTVLLDYKMTNKEDYKRYTLLDKERTDFFLSKLQEKGKAVWIRQVIVEGINDNELNAHRLRQLKAEYTCIKKIELLPFRKMCKTKYEALGIEFPFKDKPETSNETIKRLEEILNN